MILDAILIFIYLAGWAWSIWITCKQHKETGDASGFAIPFILFGVLSVQKLVEIIVTIKAI